MTARDRPQRFPLIAPETMTPAQREVANTIAAGPRGSLRGPFQTWLRSPDFAARMEKVGEYVRFTSSVPTRLNELAILITARAWTAQFEWWAHHRMAMDAGLDRAVAVDIAEGRRPTAMKPDEAVVYDFCTELLETHAVSDPTFAAALGLLGEQGVVDLIAANGYYGAVSMTLNVAEVPLPEGATPLKPLTR